MLFAASPWSYPRRREPDLARPYHAWGYPWSVWIVTVGSVSFLVGTLAGDLFNGLAAFALLAVGLIGARTA